MKIATRIVAFAIVAWASASAFAKPLYITVPRSYGTQESAAVDVAFEGREPVELRVLQPDPLEPFILAQSNLRRAYEQPTTIANPGRYAAKGVNAIREPGTFLMNALGAEWRTSIGGFPKRTPSAESKPVSKLEEGPEKLVNLPEGMKLIHREWLNLDLGGDVKDFNVPGFTAFFGGEGGYQERRVNLAPLPAGLYVLQVVQGKVEGQVVLSVTDLKVQAKQSDGEILVRVAGPDMKPVSGAQVQMYLGAAKGPSGATDAHGELHLKTNEPRVLLTARANNDLAVVDTDFYSTLAIVPDAFIYADRPIYRPGDKVGFRGVVRQPDSFLARLFTPKNRSVSVDLLTADNRTVTTKASVDEFGCFHGTLDVPKDLDTGVLRLDATLDGRHENAELRVQEYVKPTFYVELVGDQETVQPGGSISLHVRGRRYAGGAAKNTAYEYFLYRSLLDAPAWVDDSGLGAKGSNVTYGTEASKEGGLSAPERLFSSLEARGTNGEDPWQSAAKLDDNGEADIKIDVPALKPGDERRAWKYTVTVRARDDQGTFANVARTLFLSPTEVLGAIVPSAKVLKQGSDAQLSIRSTTLSGKASPSIAGKLDLVLRDADEHERTLSSETFTTDDQGIWRGKLPTTNVGSLIARVTLTDKNGHPWTGEESALVLGEKGEAVARVANLTLQALGGALEPGQTAELAALFPQSWGADGRNEGPVWITLSGSGIYSTQLVNVSGTTLVQRFPIEERFGSAVYASIAYPTSSGRWEERTTSFRIVPRTRTLNVLVQPMRAEATPLGEQSIDLTVTDSRGRGVQAAVSVGVVDKAVYAIQSEFRPGIVDFFYPLSRNNVATFQSAEFQGYGYGEVLARKLGLLPHTEFAAIKPPTHKPNEKERDTAFWDPDVRTDADGHARITFTLPSNQTLWTVTAVAADASGRFGEGTGEFASRGAVNLVASLPQFLRAGDAATGSLRVAVNQGNVSYKLNVSGAGAAQINAAVADVSLTSGSEKVFPFELKAGSDGKADVSFLLQGKEPLRDVKHLPVRPATIEETVSAVAWKGGDLDLKLPPGAVVMSSELTLQPTTVEVALTNVEDLLEYPYGCLEQLTSSTVPNIALYRTLEKSGALAQLDPQSRALLAEAQSRAAQGVQRILNLEVKGGGFTWFNGYSQPDPALTMIALDGLSYAVEAGIVPREDVRIRESTEWLAKQDVPPSLEPTRAYVLARLNGAREAPRARALVDKLQPGDTYALAMAVLAAEESGVANEPDYKAKVATLVGEAQRALLSNAVYTPHADFFWSYPLRDIGMTAILTHAASYGSLDVAQARARIVQLLANGRDLSTFDRSTAILHSLWLIERDAKELKAMPPVTADAAGTAVELEPRGLGLAGKLAPTVTHVHVGNFEGVASIKARVRTPLASVTADANGMSLERTYFALRNGALAPIKAGDSIAQGEDVYVELTLNAHDGDAAKSFRSAYYVVDDPVPAGFTPLIDDKTYRGPPMNLPLAHEALKRRSLSPEHATFFFEEPTWWSDTPRHIGYVMRAQFPGTFNAPPATVQDMYAQAVHGRTAAATLTIAPSAAQ
ncbi:MAG: alpha-2-macroglobulin [Deltaproteobacteria bacterium]|nr:alpha-2-macroglobulin [Deltaproteobacteria bacterium]